PVAASMKLFDDQGKPVDLVTGVGRYLLPGNIVDMKTAAKNAPAAKSKSRSKSKTASSGPDHEIIEIRFVSGKVGDVPNPLDPPKEELNLRPDPNWKGNVFGGEGVKTDPYWIKYIPSAKVG